MARVKALEPISIATPALESNPDLRVWVIYTDLAGTMAALSTAGQLACDLDARLVLLVAKVVPYPLPLEEPPVSGDFTDAAFARIAAEFETEIAVRVYLCRDRDAALRDALPVGSLVVIGGEEHWWPSKAGALVRRLRRDGHEVVVAGNSKAPTAKLAPVRVKTGR